MKSPPISVWRACKVFCTEVIDQVLEATGKALTMSH
jgi:hypothetical protein